MIQIDVEDDVARGLIDEIDQVGSRRRLDTRKPFVQLVALRETLRVRLAEPDPPEAA